MAYEVYTSQQENGLGFTSYLDDHRGELTGRRLEPYTVQDGLLKPLVRLQKDEQGNTISSKIIRR
jgi:hypothetical protein